LEFERRRQAERVDVFAQELNLERGKEQLDRGKEQLDRGKEQLDRGKEQLDRGGPTQVAADIFQKAAALGGHLIVAFIAPVGASGRNVAQAPTSSFPQLDAPSAAAVAGVLIRQAMNKFSATPGGPKVPPAASPKAEAPKKPPY
jgi:hypothetical protein